MIYQLLLYFVCLMLDIMAAQEKDLEIALLRQQLRILERKANVCRQSCGGCAAKRDKQIDLHPRGQKDLIHAVTATFLVYHFDK